MSSPRAELNKCIERIQNVPNFRIYGKVTKIIGLVIEGLGRNMPVGSMCHIASQKNRRCLLAEVVGFNENSILLMPLGDMKGIEPGSQIVPLEEKAYVGVGWNLLGRVIDGLGNPIDGKGAITHDELYPLYADPINPIERKPIDRPLDVGIRAINGLLTLGKGQRIGILAGAGLGKSTLLGMMARHTKASVNVIALIGERGREVHEFIDKNLGQEGFKKSVVVAATADQPPLVRMRGAFIAAAISEFFRDQGEDVLLIMDSITRFAMSAREVGLAIGEPPTTRGYTPSVFAHLPKLLERAGTKGSANGKGSITGIYAVLVEGDDLQEPVSDAMQAILDGHIVLSRDLANRNHYPAIDVLESISRVMVDVAAPEHLDCAGKLVHILSTYAKAEDLINIGAYAAGSNEQIDCAIEMIGKVNAYLRQGIEESFSLKESIDGLRRLFDVQHKGARGQNPNGTD